MRDHNVLLAFDMGTGKTATTLHAIESLREEDDIQTVGLIIAPASLLSQWGAEIEKFTNSTYTIVRGAPKARKVIYLGLRGFDYAIMTYDTYVRDEGLLSHIDFSFIVLDEATAIKAFKTKRTMAMKRAGKKIPIRYALTGTPVENGKPEELFSILEWVDPKIPGPWWKFEKEHITRSPMGWVEGYRNIKKFHDRVKGNILRKTIHDPEVSKYLPEVITPEPIFVNMDTKTSRVYWDIAGGILADLDAYVEKNIEQWWKEWSDQDPDHPDGKVMAKIQTLRMLLDHPVAVYASADRYDDPSDDRGSEFASGLIASGVIDGLPAPKFEAFTDYLNDFLGYDEANKAVVFCSFVDVAEHIHNSMPLSSVLFTGSMSGPERDAAKKRFQENPEIRVFVSTDAGGYGLDLPQANLLINYDLPWQAGLLKQRNARIRRASSEWEHVVVQDFIVNDTLEERLRDSLRHKMAVSDAFVDGEGILEDGTLASSLESLRSFLSGKSMSDPYGTVILGGEDDPDPMFMTV